MAAMLSAEPLLSVTTGVCKVGHSVAGPAGGVPRDTRSHDANDKGPVRRGGTGALEKNCLASGVAVDVVGVLLLPGEERAQLLAGGLDRVRGTLGAQLQELGCAGILVLDEALGEGT